MAREKMAPISAILSELRQHCESSSVFKKALTEEQDPIKKQRFGFGLGCKNVVIATLCDVLERIVIPDEEMGKVISELEALSRINDHCAITGLIRKLKES